MSYAHTKRRKLIARLKREAPTEGWYRKFRQHVRDTVRRREGSPLFTAEQAMQLRLHTGGGGE